LNKKGIVILGTTLVASFGIADYLISRSKAVSEASIQPPRSKVSIVLTAWHEDPEILRNSLESLHEQNIVKQYPGEFEFITAGCEGVDVELASEYSDYVLCPIKGKLTARDQAIRASKGEIIVAADADVYFAQNTLNLLLEPFSNPEVVATTARTDHGYPILEAIGDIPMRLLYMGRMMGRASAFYKDVYLASGGFDLSINQNNMRELLQEEEYNFRKRLEQFGKVAFVNVSVFHSQAPREGHGLH
jgi:cellulose synthase/poly-beta-1,6-N-acetylglucosamine synthase-like glycosyltransferase